MNDKELLEKAAKAACVDLQLDDDGLLLWVDVGFLLPYSHKVWNPLTDDGDALRLAVKLGMRVYIYNGGGDDYTCVATDELSFTQETIKVMHDEDSSSATRRAITRAAAAMAG